MLLPLKASALHIFYINLQKSQDRRKHMELQLDKLNHKYTRWQGSVATKPEMKYVSENMKYDSKAGRGSIPKRNGWCSQKSNTNLLKHILIRFGNKDELFLVFEDDVWISPLASRNNTLCYFSGAKGLAHDSFRLSSGLQNSKGKPHVSWIKPENLPYNRQSNIRR